MRRRAASAKRPDAASTCVFAFARASLADFVPYVSFDCLLRRQSVTIRKMELAKDLSQQFDQAATAIRDADALLIGAGAGMGVDSGLPDFRGNEGFWNAYPPFR